MVRISRARANIVSMTHIRGCLIPNVPNLTEVLDEPARIPLVGTFPKPLHVVSMVAHAGKWGSLEG